MIFTNGERCEFAKNLRGQAETWRGYLPDDTLWDMSDHQFTESVLMAFGLDDLDMPVHEAFDKLADMFDAFAKEAKVDIAAIREAATEIVTEFDYDTHINVASIMNAEVKEKILEAIGDADKRK